MVGSRLRESGLAGSPDTSQAASSLWSYGSRAQGWFFLALGSISFFGFVCAAVLPKFLPGSHSHDEDGIKIDRAHPVENIFSDKDGPWVYREGCNSEAWSDSPRTKEKKKQQC